MKRRSKRDGAVLIGGSDLKDVVDAARRSFLTKAGLGLGLGAVAAVDVLGLSRANATVAPPASRTAPNLGKFATGQFPATAKRVIYIHLLGANSTVDLWDYKPLLVKMNGQPMPASELGTQKLSSMSSGQAAFFVTAPVKPLRQHGQSGVWVSDFLPHLAGVVDELCFVKSMYTEQLNHGPAQMLLHTGFQLAGRPSDGAWVSYALGNDNTNLPSFIVMTSGILQGVPTDTGTWSAGFLPSEFQGAQLREGADPVLYLNNIGGVTSEERRQLLDSLSNLARADYRSSQDPDIFSRIRQYEMSYRMQHSIPEIVDFSDESKSVLDMYGPNVMRPGTFAHNALIARRLSERGVKFITLYDLGWDHHFQLPERMTKCAQKFDQPAAALIRDLKQRGMLEDTLVVCGSEFGRTPFAQGSAGAWGRDHHGGNFTWWMAGGGTRAGYSHGQTDDFNYNVIGKPTTTYDMNATMLRLLGIDHERLTYFYLGRNYRLTDQFGDVVNEVIDSSDAALRLS
ncbi:MAG TPA: DUF1501 domain-containing protein [Steroidobacteraceae bacterium]|nr:DUF1501 domain-containing protein [Steroidobacteraceae bacterium]